MPLASVYGCNPETMPTLTELVTSGGNSGNGKYTNQWKQAIDTFQTWLELCEYK
jgi:hypothetical protein